MCHDVGIKAGAGFMIGFPHETKEMMQTTIKESCELGLDKVYINRFIAIPISELYNEVVAKGLSEFEFENIIIPKTEHCSADEVTEIAYIGTLTRLQRLTYGLPRPFKEFIKKYFTGTFNKIARWVYS